MIFVAFELSASILGKKKPPEGGLRGLLLTLAKGKSQNSGVIHKGIGQVHAGSIEPRCHRLKHLCEVIHIASLTALFSHPSNRSCQSARHCGAGCCKQS